MNCSAWVIRNIGRMTRSIFHRNFRNCDGGLAGSTHTLPPGRTRQLLVVLSANLLIRGLQVHGLEILSVSNGILLVSDVHLLDLALTSRKTPSLDRLFGAFSHGSRMTVMSSSGDVL